MMPPPKLLGVVSDTHGHTGHSRDAARMLESLGVEAILHCGDIGSADVIACFARWPTHFVLGNVDRESRSHRAQIVEAITAAGQTFHGDFGALTLAGRRIALLHGDDTAALRQAIRCGEYDLVCSGHTHRSEQMLHGKTLALNPGALYRATPHTLAVVDLATMIATHVSL